MKYFLRNIFPENIEATYRADKKASRIVADPELLRRILTNLTNNAIKPCLRAGDLIQACEKDDDFVITVQDSGVAISEEIKEKLFTPLVTTKSKGQDFGLAVVKRLTEALGGTVTFETKKEKA